MPINNAMARQRMQAQALAQKNPYVTQRAATRPDTHAAYVPGSAIPPAYQATFQSTAQQPTAQNPGVVGTLAGTQRAPQFPPGMPTVPADNPMAPAMNASLNQSYRDMLMRNGNPSMGQPQPRVGQNTPQITPGSQLSNAIDAAKGPKMGVPQTYQQQKAAAIANKEQPNGDFANFKPAPMTGPINWSGGGSFFGG